MVMYLLFWNRSIWLGRGKYKNTKQVWMETLGVSKFIQQLSIEWLNRLSGLCKLAFAEYNGFM